MQLSQITFFASSCRFHPISLFLHSLQKMQLPPYIWPDWAEEINWQKLGGRRRKAIEQQKPQSLAMTMTVMMMMVIASRCTFPIGEQSDETRAVSGKKMHSFDNCFCWDWGKTTLRNKSPTIPLPKSFVANPNMPIEPHLTVFEKKIEREASTLQKLSPLIRSSFFFGPAKKKTLSVSQYQRMVGRAASNLFKEISSSIHIIFLLACCDYKTVCH